MKYSDCCGISACRLLSVTVHALRVNAMTIHSIGCLMEYILFSWIFLVVVSTAQRVKIDYAATRYLPTL